MRTGRSAGGMLALASAAALVVVLVVIDPLARSQDEALRPTAITHSEMPAAQSVAAEAAQQRVNDDSEGKAPPDRVRAAPAVAAANTPHPSPRPVPPAGFSFAGAPVALHKAAHDARATPAKTQDSPDDLDWLFPQADAVSVARRQAQQVAASQRDWVFGWLRLADGAKVDDLPGGGSGGVAVLGSTGRLARVKLPTEEARLNALLELDAVDGVGVVPPLRKVAGEFLQEARSRPHERHPVFVTLMASDADGHFGDALRALGAEVGRFDPDTRTYTANVDAGSLDAVIAADFTLAVVPVGVYRAVHDTAVPGLGADALRVRDGAPGLFSGTGGGSVPIAVMDTGLNTNHLDIATHRESICAVNFIHAAGEDADLWVDANGHGTHVTGTMVGNGFVEARYAGMAPAVAHVRFAKVLSRFGFGSGADIARAMDWLARPSACAAAGSDVAEVKPLVVNMSLGLDNRYWRGRTVEERKLDAVAWAHRQLYVVANSNAGEYSFSDYAAAKNSLAVGATVDGGEVARFSSRGPTFDGRLVPHVVAIGVDVHSAQGNGSRGNYVSFSGTSMASPATAGVATLLMDALPEHREHPALIRARLMAAAIKVDAWLDTARAFPTTNSGGPGALQAQYGLGKVSARTSVLQRDLPDGWTSGAASASMEEGSYGYREITVPEGAARLDVVMAWDEPPADTIGSAVLNDVDLYLDKDGDCLEAACGEHASLSRVDNVEWIIVRNPSPGTWRVKAVPHRIYTAAPRVGVAWQVVRGATTPNLRVAVDEVRGHEVALTVSTDAYVAAGVRLHATCQYAGQEECKPSIDVRDVASEDGVVRETATYRRAVELGEIVVGEEQNVVLNFRDLSEPAGLYFRVSSWNARPAVASVALRGDDAAAEEPPAEATRPPNDEFANPATLSARGSAELDLRQATFEPGEPLPRAAYSRPMASLWYEWTAPASGPARFGIHRNETSGSGTVYLDLFVGDNVAGLTPLISREWGLSFFAVEGATYRVRVSVAAGRGFGSATLRWSQGPRPANDDFADATPIEGEHGEISGSNFGATLEAAERVGSLAATVWYRWTAPADGDWRILTSGSGSFVLVFVGDDVASLRLVAGGATTEAFVSVKADRVFHIAVASKDAFAAGRGFDLYWETQSERDVGNDDFANAEPLEGETGDHRVSTGGSVEPDEPSGTGVKTRWWVWQAPSSGRFTWRLDSRLRLAVFAAERPESEAEEAEDGFDATLGTLRTVAVGHARSPELAFDASEGTRYWISVGYETGERDAFGSLPARANLTWGRTPANDDLATPATITESSASSTVSAIYATVERSEHTGALGRSSLWWEFTPASAGWMRFWIEDSPSATLAVYRPESGGGLRLLTKSVGNWRPPEVDPAPVEALFSTVADQRYLVRLGLLSLSDQETSEITLRWEETEAPRWLRYAGTLSAEALDLRNASSPTVKMAFEDRGEALYLAAPNGLHVLRRDPNSGALTPPDAPIAQIDGVQLANANALLWDAAREALYVHVQDCAWRRLAPAEDSRLILRDDGEILAFDESSDCDEVDWALLHATSSFVYFERDGGIALLDLGDDGRPPSETPQYAPEQAISRPVLTRDAHLYASEGNTPRIFAINAQTGALTLEETDIVLYNTPTALAIGGDDRFLFAITGDGVTDVYTRTTPTRIEYLATLWADGLDRMYRDGRPCVFALARADGNALDAFCRNSAFVVALRGEAEETRLQAADYIANWRPDRFNNHVPKFSSPSELLASPDGKHAYLFDEGTSAILHFERIGNALPEGDATPDDPAVAQSCDFAGCPTRSNSSARPHEPE